MTVGLPSVNEIVKDQIYLGNLSAALSIEQRKKLGITHIVSVCPEYPSTGPNHLTIAIEDTEYENILIHLPRACKFIEAALDSGGKALIHCVMGISRSTTVVAAYLMKTRQMNRSAALRFVKQKRPQIHPNYGFIRQLEVFSECRYDPCPTNPIYITWKRQQKQNITKFLNSMIDTTPIILDKLLLSSDFSNDPEQAESLLWDLGITHLLSLSPSQTPAAGLPSTIKHKYISIPHHKQDALLISLPYACKFIQEAIDSGGQVLVHCIYEFRACVVVCAFLMVSRKISADEAFAVLEDELPLFNPTRNFSRHLELFEACGYNPTPDHPLVRDWIASERSLDGTPASQKNTDICKTAANLLSETGIDTREFEKALVAIQNMGLARS